MKLDSAVHRFSYSWVLALESWHKEKQRP